MCNQLHCNANFKGNLWKIILVSRYSQNKYHALLSLHLSDFLSSVWQICQRLTNYGVHFHRVLPEKKSQTGILLGVCSKGVIIFEVHNGARMPVLRFLWRETKKISFSVCWSFFLYIYKIADWIVKCLSSLSPHSSWVTYGIKIMVCQT